MFCSELYVLQVEKKKKEIKVVIFATKPINWRFFSEITLEVVCGHVIAKRLEPQIR